MSHTAETGQRSGPTSPLPQRIFDLSSDWFDNPSREHTKQASNDSIDKKGSFYAYESRSTTPESVAVDIGYQPNTWDEKRARTPADIQNDADEGVDLVLGGVGRLPDEVYDRTLNWWRAAIRRQLVKSVEWESKVLAKMQNYVRTPFLDAYFVYTSSLGTHTFFMTVLPAFFFFGYQDVGRGLLVVLAFGVYVASFVKDLICSPRPFAPPVTRLTIGTHHLEYGFPSTHSTNSMSIALYLFTQIYLLYTTPASAQSLRGHSAQNLTLVNQIVETIVEEEMMISRSTFYAANALLGFYVFSIVYGRLYTAMHSFTDCIVGTLLGTMIWALQIWCGEYVDVWVRSASWTVPAVTFPFCLLLVHRHPQPVDDCPCFEDAIAFVSVVLGEFFSRWYMARYKFDETFFTGVMAGHPIGSWTEMCAWWSIAAGKMVIGVLAIFSWRIFAKFLLHRLLPPIFRFLAQVFTLPHRRFYTPATDYKNVPPEKGLRAIPSVIDLPGMVELERDDVGASTAHNKEPPTRGRDIKLRGARGAKSENNVGKANDGLGLNMEEMGGKDVETVTHYDADVLTKVFVYCGIGIIATGVMPVVFELIGWGLKAV